MAMAMDMSKSATAGCDGNCDCGGASASSCGGDCACGGTKEVPTTASRETLLAELKKLLNDNTENGRAERQARIDDLIAGLDDLAEAD